MGGEVRVKEYSWDFGAFERQIEEMQAKTQQIVQFVSLIVILPCIMLIITKLWATPESPKHLCLTSSSNHIISVIPRILNTDNTSICSCGMTYIFLLWMQYRRCSSRCSMWKGRRSGSKWRGWGSARGRNIGGVGMRMGGRRGGGKLWRRGRECRSICWVVRIGRWPTTMETGRPAAFTGWKYTNHQQTYSNPKYFHHPGSNPSKIYS